MIDAAQIWELLLRGVAIGALAATGAGVWRGGKGEPARIAGVLFAVAVAAYALQSASLVRPHLGWAAGIVRVFALGGAGFFWLFVVTLFDDRKLTYATLAPAAALIAFGLAIWRMPASTQNTLWIGHNLIEAGLAIHALTVIVRSWRDDLVDARRRLRGPFVGFVALFVLVLSALEIGEDLGVRAPWYQLAGAAALAALCVAGACVFLRADPALFGPAMRADPRAGLDAGDRLTLEQLDAFMNKEGWRQEGLTIGAVAAEVGAPEHRLRRLINDHLGHRNFAAFVNARRIDIAKRALSDPTKARTAVSVIAFDLEFGSLGPFNRAFKEATGQTPTEWRRRALEGGSPSPENSR